MSDEVLSDLIGEELRRAVPPPVATLAQRLAARAAPATAAVLFYGSALRDEALDGVLDFYVLLDRAGAWPGSRVAAFANRVLPPNVGYFEDHVDGRVLRAKYAVMSLAQFRGAMSVERIDTTLWARFSQPCACVYARGEAEWTKVRDAIAGAVITAACWAAALGPAQGDALAYWRALYARTYEAELRVERSTRGEDLIARDLARYAHLLPAAWRAAGIAFETGADDSLHPRLSPAERAAASRRWALRRRLGRPLNGLRLIKAAFTFDNPMDYLAWKIERHSGVQLTLSDFQKRHPVLAAPGLFLRLRKLGVLR